MTEHDYIKASVFLGWRMFQAFVVIPATTIVLILAAVTGDAPVQKTILATHHWAETSVRPAPAGAVLVAECVTQNTGDIKPPVLCDATQPKSVPIAEFANSAASQVGALYAVLVLISIAGLMLVRPGRRFFGLSTPIQQ